jgi:hypothetical protein
MGVLQKEIVQHLRSNERGPYKLFGALQVNKGSFNWENWSKRTLNGPCPI